VDEPFVPFSLGGFTAIENPANGLSFFVEWETTRDVVTDLSVRCDEGRYEQYFVDEVPKGAHSVFVMGLYTGAVCQMEAIAEAGEELISAVIEISVGPLPDFIPALDVVVRDEERIQPGWTLWNLTSSADIGPLIIAIVDPEGEYRWYHQLGFAAVPGAGNDTRVVPEGILIGGRSPFPTAHLISWEGEVLWEAPFNNHHEIQPSPYRDDHMLYLGFSTENCPEETNEATINEFDFINQETIWTWKICDHYTPDVVGPDWSHVNGVEPIPGTQSIVISVRDQNILMQFNRDTDEVEWILGEDGQFEMIGEGEWFIRQHAPEVQENGNILLFDNGQLGKREYSRAIELALTFDEAGQPYQAEIVWEFFDTQLFAKVKSDADRMLNGNTLITYGGLTDPFESLLLEVNHEGEVVWELRTPPEWSTYRSERVVEINYGFVREATDQD
jgi:hypothetical protein